MEKYVPKIHDGKYVEMLVEGEICHVCGKVMLRKYPDYGGIFPMYHKINQDAQMKESNLVYKSSSSVDCHTICQGCADAGMASFWCVGCEETKPSNKVQESIGYPSECLCSDCYSTMPAKEWFELVERLQEEHRYDL